MIKAKGCLLVDPGLSPLAGAQVIHPDEVSQLWRVTFDDGFEGDIRISPTEGDRGKIGERVTELAELVYRDGKEQFPYSTNNLTATLSSLRRR